MSISAVGSAGPSQPLTANQVTPALVKGANNDGDGRTGAAALNDGDAAASKASQYAKAHRVDVKA